MRKLREILSNYELLRIVYRFITKCRLWFKFKWLSLFTNVDLLEFRCNICGRVSRAPLDYIYERESSSCYFCGSTLRLRSVIHVLSLELFGRSMPIPNFPDCNLPGIGMSDSDIYALPLQKKMQYKNTFYHKEPRLDIKSIKPEWQNSFDFIICSDVFEHIKPPVEAAFKNLFNLLKNRGVCVFTVPYTKNGETKEHFPELVDYKIVKKKGKKLLINRTKDGVTQVYDNLRFHGGHGETIEMRVFSKPSLMKIISEVGFDSIKFHNINKPEFGIIWMDKQHQPLSMRRLD